MAFQPLLSRPNSQAILLGAGAFIFLYFGLIGYLNLATRSTESGEPNFGLIGSPVFGMAWGLLQYILPGLVTGYFAKRSPLMYGAILGTVTAIFLYLYSQLGFAGEKPAIGFHMFSYWTLIGVIWCSLGTIIGDHFAKKTRQP